MRRLCLIAIGLVGSAAATDAVAQTKPGRLHVARTTTETVVPRNDPLALNNVASDSSPTPYRVQSGYAAQFPPIRSHPPVEPQGGFSIRAGRDNPDEPMTGGLKFRF
jgi:hypothetical protein